MVPISVLELLAVAAALTSATAAAAGGPSSVPLSDSVPPPGSPGRLSLKTEDAYALAGDGGRQDLCSSSTNSWIARRFDPANDSVLSVSATVPGQIHLDLERAGIINNTYRARNVDANAWVREASWSFELSFELTPAMSAMEEVFLVLDGVDTVGRVFLNEQPSNKTDTFGPLGKHGKTRPFELLPTDVPGLPVQDMYLRHTFPVGAALKRTGINRLVVQTASVSPLVVGPVINASHHGLWVQHPWTYVRKEPSQVRNRANFLIFLDDVCLSRACLGSRRLFHTEKSNQNASVSRSSDGTGRRRQLKHRASGVPCIW